MGEEPILDAEELRKCWEVNQKNGVAAVREREFQRQVPKKGPNANGSSVGGRLGRRQLILTIWTSLMTLARAAPAAR